MKKEKLCKGCGRPLLSKYTTLQQCHPNMTCYKLWKKNKKQTAEQKLRKAVGVEEDKLIRKNDVKFQEECICTYDKLINLGFPESGIKHSIDCPVRFYYEYLLRRKTIKTF